MTRANANNLSVRKKLAQIHECLNVLEARDVMIIGLSIDGPTPLIEVQESSGCAGLKQATTKWSNHNGRRVIERVAIVGQCQVRWTERT